MQEIDNFQSSNQLCTTHKRARLCLASLSPDSKNPFLCNVCQFSNKSSVDNLISIEEILYADQTEPIQHWPQGIDEVSYNFLKNKQTSILKEEMQKGILKFYDELKSEIGKLLLDSQKKLLLELDRIQIGSDEAIDLYNYSFKRNELTDIFSNNKKLFSHEDYLCLLSSLLQTSAKDLKQLSFKIEERKSNELEFREFQQNEILDLLDTLISKVNENATLMFSKEIDNSLFEEYSYLPIPTISEQQKIEESKNIKIINLKKIINKHENKSTFMLQKQTIFDVEYQQKQIIRITNPNKSSGRILPYFYQIVSGKQSFKLGFENLTSFKNFTFAIIPEMENVEFQFPRLFDRIYQHFELTKQKNILFAVGIDLSQNILSISADGFNEKEHIKYNSKDQTFFSFEFTLKENCKGFEIREYNVIKQIAQ